MNFLSQLFGGQPGVTTGIPQGMDAATASRLYSGPQSPYPTMAGPTGLAGPMGGGGLDIQGFAAEQYGKGGPQTFPGRQPSFGQRFGMNLGQALQGQQGGAAPQLPEMPQMSGGRGRTLIAELLQSIGGGGNYLGRLGGSF